MTNQYHDQLDAFEARVRAEQEETDIHEAEKCTCLEFAGDDLECPIHCTTDTMTMDEFESKMAGGIYTQLTDAGFGSGGVQ